MREISLDTETTGLNPADGHRIIEIGCVEMNNRVRTGNFFHAYVNPQRDIPAESFNIHGIKEEFLQDKPLFPEVVDDFMSFIGDSPLVIHNAAFDMRFINSELEKAGHSALPHKRAIDTLALARRRFPGAPASLDALCKRFRIDLSKREKHGALLDAELLAEMYLELMGGGQEAMDLKAEALGEKGIEEETEKKVIQARENVLSEEEIARHKKFVQQQLNNPIWDN